MTLTDAGVALKGEVADRTECQADSEYEAVYYDWFILAISCSGLKDDQC